MTTVPEWVHFIHSRPPWVVLLPTPYSLPALSQYPIQTI